MNEFKKTKQTLLGIIAKFDTRKTEEATLANIMSEAERNKQAEKEARLKERENYFHQTVKQLITDLLETVNAQVLDNNGNLGEWKTVVSKPEAQYHDETSNDDIGYRTDSVFDGYLQRQSHEISLEIPEVGTVSISAIDWSKLTQKKEELGKTQPTHQPKDFVSIGFCTQKNANQPMTHTGRISTYRPDEDFKQRFLRITNKTVIQLFENVYEDRNRTPFSLEDFDS